MDSDSEAISDFEFEVPVFTNYSEIINLYKEHLLGNIEYSPTYGGPIEEETIPLIPQLLILNSAQILTIDSQPGCVVELGGLFCSLPEESKKDEALETYRQRAYLECYMTKDQFQKLMKSILLTELLVFPAVPAISDTNVSFGIPVTVKSTITENDSVDEIVTSMPIGLSEGLDMIFMNSGSGDAARILENLYLVQIVDPIWGRPTYLFDMIAQIFQ